MAKIRGTVVAGEPKNREPGAVVDRVGAAGVTADAAPSSDWR
jgi:hypothetical protein